MVRTLSRSVSDTQLDQLVRAVSDDHGDPEWFEEDEEEEVDLSEMSKLCSIKVWVRGMVDSRQLRRLILLGIDAATAQMAAESFLDGPLSPSRALCEQVVEPTLHLWQHIAASPCLAQVPVCLDVVTNSFDPGLPRWLLGDLVSSLTADVAGLFSEACVAKAWRIRGDVRDPDRGEREGIGGRGNEESEDKSARATRIVPLPVYKTDGARGGGRGSSGREQGLRDGSMPGWLCSQMLIEDGPMDTYVSICTNIATPDTALGDPAGSWDRKGGGGDRQGDTRLRSRRAVSGEVVKETTGAAGGWEGHGPGGGEGTGIPKFIPSLRRMVHRKNVSLTPDGAKGGGGQGGEGIGGQALPQARVVMCRANSKELKVFVYGFPERELVAPLTNLARRAAEKGKLLRNRAHTGVTMKMGLPSLVVASLHINTYLSGSSPQQPAASVPPYSLSGESAAAVGGVRIIEEGALLPQDLSTGGGGGASSHWSEKPVAGTLARTTSPTAVQHSPGMSTGGVGWGLGLGADRGKSGAGEGAGAVSLSQFLETVKGSGRRAGASCDPYAVHAVSVGLASSVRAAGLGPLSAAAVVPHVHTHTHPHASTPHASAPAYTPGEVKGGDVARDVSLPPPLAPALPPTRARLYGGGWAGGGRLRLKMASCRSPQMQVLLCVLRGLSPIPKPSAQTLCPKAMRIFDAMLISVCVYPMACLTPRLRA